MLGRLGQAPTELRQHHDGGETKGSFILKRRRSVREASRRVLGQPELGPEGLTLTNDIIPDIMINVIRASESHLRNSFYSASIQRLTMALQIDPQSDKERIKAVVIQLGKVFLGDKPHRNLILSSTGIFAQKTTSAVRTTVWQ